MHYAILGPLEVVRDGEAVPLGGMRQRAVLARLLVDAGRVVPVDRLVDDVWDGLPPATAHKTLQKYVSELRKVLGQCAVRTSGGGYVVDVDDGELDSRDFERLADARNWDAALALWRGDVLADVGDLAFVLPERTRLESLRLAAVEGQLTALLDAGRHTEVVGELTELAIAHPLRERLTALRMLALYRSGRQVEALRAFDAHRKRLGDEVGVEPAAELRALEAAILAHDPALDLRAASTPPAGNLPRPLTSFVGRTSDLAAIAEELVDNRLVTLTGPGGVGKTRLALRVGADVADRYLGGVWLVDLASVRDGGMVPDTVATTLGIDVRHVPDVYIALVSAHAHRPPCMLILDNCEHLVDACSRVRDSDPPDLSERHGAGDESPPGRRRGGVRASGRTAPAPRGGDVVRGPRAIGWVRRRCRGRRRGGRRDLRACRSAAARDRARRQSAASARPR